LQASVSVWLGWSSIRVAGFSFGVVGLEWYPCCRLQFMCGWVGVVSVLQASVSVWLGWSGIRVAGFSFGVVGLEWCPCCRLQPATRSLSNVV